eukprot:155586_1
MSVEQQIEIQQKRALQKLKGKNSLIGKTENKKKKTFSIKRRKIVKPIMSGYNTSGPLISPTNTQNNNNKDVNNMNDSLNDDIINVMNDDINSLNALNGDLNDDGLNDALDNHTSNDVAQQEDAITLNLQKFDLARKAAQDQTNAIDEEEYLENCNVYVGGLHPDVDQSMLRRFFEHCGDIRQIRLDWRKKG